MIFPICICRWYYFHKKFKNSKAFDCIDHTFLRQKLYTIGVRGCILSWVMSYLENRKICVKVQGSTSNCYSIHRGVPQGSVLGPLLFNLYVNELPNHLTSTCVTMFADDTTVAVSALTAEDLNKSIIRVIHDFQNWCRENNLILNIDKTICLNFYNKKKHPIDEIVVNNIKLNESTITKFLGVFLNDNLTWSAHINHVSKTISRSYYAILKTKDVLSTHCLLNVYYSLVYSHLSYNIILWGNAPESIRLFIMQKKIIRLIFNMRNTESCKSVFVDKKIMTLPCIYIFKLLLYVKKNIHLYETNCKYHNYNTRKGKELITVNHNTSKYEYSPSYAGVKLFNKLPEHYKKENYNAFKKKLKQLLINKCYYTVIEYINDTLN